MEQAAGELADQKILDAKGFMRRPVLRQTEREVARLQGQIGETQARIEGARSQLRETEFKMAETRKSGQSDILTQLQSVIEKIAQAEQERAASSDRFQRLEIKAPRTGYVNELAVHTVGGVMSPGQTVMSIIPKGDRFWSRRRISPGEIDEVHPGQPATVRLSSLKLPTPPELAGTVASVSPDQLKDEHTGQAYFKVTDRHCAGRGDEAAGQGAFSGHARRGSHSRRGAARDRLPYPAADGQARACLPRKVRRIMRRLKARRARVAMS